MLLIFSGLLLWLSEVFCLGRRLGGERSQAIQREVQSGKISGKTLVSQMQVWLGQTTVTGCVPALSLSLSLPLSLSSVPSLLFMQSRVLLEPSEDGAPEA